MKKLFTLIFIICMAGYVSAQLVNNGGTITVESGATLVVESDITNSGTGTITNNGTIEVQGSITSAGTATFTSASGSKLSFTGSGSSTAEFGAGTALMDVDMSMTGGELTLNSDVDIDGDLTFTADDNQIFLGNNDLTLSASSAADVTGVSNSFVVTDGTGSFTKEGLTSFTFPVGAAADSQNDITLTETGTVDDISIRVLAEAYDDPTVPSGTMTSDVVAATWEITEGTTGGSDLTAAATWVSGDETTDFDNTMSAIYQYNSTDYTALQATAPASSSGGIFSISNAGLVLDGTDYIVVGDDALSSFTASLAVKVFLHGAYLASADMMRDQLRTKSLIPLTEPYTAMGAFTHVGDGGGESVNVLGDFDYTDAGDDIVDWVFIEIRDASNNVIQTRSALLQRDGDVVDTDGNNSPVTLGAFANGDYHIAVRHRNHLGVRTANVQSFTGGMTTTYDFTTAATQAQGDQQIELEPGVFGTYAGNANGGVASTGAWNFIRMTGSPTVNDFETMLNALGGNYTSTIISEYREEDINMDGNVRMTGSPAVNDFEKMLEALSGSYTNILSRAF